MKKLIVSVGFMFLVLILSASVFCQEIPKGAWGFEPSKLYEQEEQKWISGMLIYWQDASLSAEYDRNGMVTSLNLVVGEDKPKTYLFPAPATGTENSFTSAEVWRKFAENALKRCVYLTDDIYMDTEAYEFVVLSRTSRSWEFGFGTEHLVFKNNDRLVIVRRENWKGALPKTGERVFVGRHKILGSFFPVLKAGEKFVLEGAVFQGLTSQQKGLSAEALRLIGEAATRKEIIAKESRQY